MGDLIFRRNELPGTLATAIEHQGIFSWDRYGRFRHFGPETPEAKSALDHLAAVYEHNGGHPDDHVDHEMFYEAGGDAYGWPVAKEPNWAEIKAGLSQRPQPQSPEVVSVKSENANLAMVLALLKFIKGELGNKTHPDYSSEAQLGEFLESAMFGYSGVSKSNFKTKFANAKKLIPKNEA